MKAVSFFIFARYYTYVAVSGAANGFWFVPTAESACASSEGKGSLTTCWYFPDIQIPI